MLQFQRMIKGREIIVHSHEGMHAEEMFALFQIERLATQTFLDRYCSDGKLYLGVEGKEFDSHTVTPGRASNPGECCSSLVADALGVSKMSMVSGFLHYFMDRRLRHFGSAFDLPHLVDVMHVKRESIEAILAWAFFGFEAKIRGPSIRTKSAITMDVNVRGEKIRLVSYGGVDLYVTTMLFLLEDFSAGPIDDLVFNRVLTIVPHQLLALAKKLGVEQMLELKLILQVADGNNHYRFDLGTLLRDSHRSGRPVQQTIDWGLAGLRAKFHDQQLFFGPTRSEFEREIQIETIPGPHSRPLKLGVVMSDNPQMARYARSRYGGSIDVVIQIRSTGNVYIATRFESGIKLHRVAYLLSLAEQHAGGKVIDDKWEHLTASTLLPDGRWFFQHTPQALFNGTMGIEVPPTVLPKSELVRLVKAGLQPPAGP